MVVALLGMFIKEHEISSFETLRHFEKSRFMKHDAYKPLNVTMFLLVEVLFTVYEFLNWIQ